MIESRFSYSRELAFTRGQYSEVFESPPIATFADTPNHQHINILDQPTATATRQL